MPSYTQTTVVALATAPATPRRFQHNIDSTRVVSAGYSNGGYLTYFALTRDATFHFAAGIAGAGPSCWDTMVLTSDVPTFQGALTGDLSWKTPMYAGRQGLIVR